MPHGPHQLDRIEHSLQSANHKLDRLLEGQTLLMRHLIERLWGASRRLERAVQSAGSQLSSTPFPENIMPNATLDQLAAQVTATENVIDSAVALINGIAARIQAAVDAAIAGGASAADLAPVTQEIADLNARTQGLADAVAANTPPPTP